MPRYLAFLVAVFAALVAAAPAAASSVGLEYDFRDYHGLPIAYGSVLKFNAAAGEQNDLTVTPDGDGFVFADAGSTIGTGTGCDKLDDHTVRCEPEAIPETGPGTGPYTGIEGIGVYAGDGDDKVTAGAYPGYTGGTIAGEDGDDTLTTVASDAGNAPSLFGGAGDDVLTGSDSADLIVAGYGADTVSGGAGSDTLGDDGFEGEADSFDGGAGTDVVSYKTSLGDMRIDLAFGSGSGGDTYAGVENATGGRGDDTILGDEGRNRVTGGAGNDTVDGRAGPDRVVGGGGTDRLRGGSGDDSLGSGEPGGTDGRGTPEHERVRCGGGDDVVTGRETGDPLATDCERAVVLGDSDVAQQVRIQPLHMGARRLTGVGLECAASAGTRGCRGSVAVRVRRGRRLVTLGRVRVSAKPGETVELSVPLAPGATRGLRRGLVAVQLMVRLQVEQTTEYDPPEDPYVAKLDDVVTTFARR
jgi:Ca2+-binding RTX toxin-like protein